MTVSAKKLSIWLHNVTDNVSILKTNAKEQWEIASLVKLMAAMLIIDSNSDLTEILEISTDPIHYDLNLRSRTWSVDKRPWKVVPTPTVFNNIIQHCAPLGAYTKDKLLRSLLSFGDNYAVDTFTKNYPGRTEQFLKDLNEHARALGMEQSNFTSAHGCVIGDYATIDDVYKMSVASLEYDLIKQYTTLVKENFNGVELDNLNAYLMETFRDHVDDILISKTGFSLQDGLHMIMVVEVKGKIYSAIVLGSPNWEMRNTIMRKLMSTILHRAEK